MVRRVKDWNRLLRGTMKAPSLSNLSYKLSNSVHPCHGQQGKWAYQTSLLSSLPEFYSARPPEVHYVLKITPKFTSEKSKS